MHAEIVEHILGVCEHVHQMRDRRTLIAADIGNAGLQQRLGQCEDTLSVKGVAIAEPQILDFPGERTFSHGNLSSDAGSADFARSTALASSHARLDFSE